MKNWDQPLCEAVIYEELMYKDKVEEKNLGWLVGGLA